MAYNISKAVAELRNIVERSIINNSKIHSELKAIDTKSMSTIDTLLAMCKIITSRFENLKIRYLPWYHNYSTKGTFKKENTEVEETELMIYGTQLIYTIRKFLYKGEELLFNYGVYDTKGKKTRTVTITQKELLMNLSPVKGGIGIKMKTLQAQFKNFKTTNRMRKGRKKNLWHIVNSLSDFEPDYKNKDEGKEYKATFLWKNQKDDLMIYAASEKAKDLYYNYNGSLQFFNKGWLYEWYNDIYENWEEEEYNNIIVHSLLNERSIKPIISQTDTIRGTKQGDYKNAQGQYVQSKYGNEKIISINNILTVIYQLEKDLISYKKGTKGAEQKLKKDLEYHFAPAAVETGKNEIESTLTGFLGQLGIR